MKQRDVATLVGSLATVAIASLGGPMPAAAAGLKEASAYGLKAHDVTAGTRELQKQVATTVQGWADGEALTGSVVAGLAEANSVVAAHGITAEELAGFGYDAAAATDKVVARARAADAYWGTEDHYAVAERAIRSTFDGVCAKLRDREAVLIPAIRVLRSLLIEQASELAELRNDLGHRQRSQHRNEVRNLAAELLHLSETLWRRGWELYQAFRQETQSRQPEEPESSTVQKLHDEFMTAMHKENETHQQTLSAQRRLMLTSPALDKTTEELVEASRLWPPPTERPGKDTYSRRAKAVQAFIDAVRKELGTPQTQ